MNRYNDRELSEIAYRNWKEEAKDQLEYINKYVDDRMVRFEDVEEVVAANVIRFLLSVGI